MRSFCSVMDGEGTSAPVHPIHAAFLPRTEGYTAATSPPTDFEASVPSDAVCFPKAGILFDRTTNEKFELPVDPAIFFRLSKRVHYAVPPLTRRPLPAELVKSTASSAGRDTKQTSMKKIVPEGLTFPQGWGTRKNAFLSPLTCKSPFTTDG